MFRRRLTSSLQATHHKFDFPYILPSFIREKICQLARVLDHAQSGGCERVLTEKVGGESVHISFIIRQNFRN